MFVSFRRKTIQKDNLRSTQRRTTTTLCDREAVPLAPAVRELKRSRSAASPALCSSPEVVNPAPSSGACRDPSQIDSPTTSVTESVLIVLVNPFSALAACSAEPPPSRQIFHRHRHLFRCHFLLRFPYRGSKSAFQAELAASQPTPFPARQQGKRRSTSKIRRS